MVVSVTHSFTSTVTDSSSTAIVKPANWNAAHVLTMSGPALIGRSTAGTGAAEEITLGTNMGFSGGSLSVIPGTTCNPQYQLFTSNGTWTKPAICTMVYIRLVGAGAGGSSGSDFQNTGPNGGSYGGDCVQFLIPASSLGSTVSVTIGAGGAGGVGSTANFNVRGSRGGTTLFGNYSATGGFAPPATISSSYMDGKLYHGANIFVSNGGFTGVFTHADYSLLSYGGTNPFGTLWGSLFPTNGAYHPGRGGVGYYTDGGGSFVSATRGGVGFANTVLNPTAAFQNGDTASAGTAQGTNASSRGYGGGGGNSVPPATGGNGYLGGGGGSGAEGNSVLPTAPQSGGTGGSGFVEVFSW